MPIKRNQLRIEAGEPSTGTGAGYTDYRPYYLDVLIGYDANEDVLYLEILRNTFKAEIFAERVDTGLIYLTFEFEDGDDYLDNPVPDYHGIKILTANGYSLSITQIIDNSFEIQCMDSDGDDSDYLFTQNNYLISIVDYKLIG